MSPAIPAVRLQTLVRPSRPIVAVNADLSPAPGLTCVRADYEDGARQAVQYLLDRGHTRIGYLSGPGGSLTRRRKTYEDVLRGHGCFDYRYVVEAGDIPPATFADGYEACRQLMAPVPGDVRPTAILAFNDVMAVGALRALHEQGLHVPDDVWVVGFDDLDFARFTVPALTTVVTPRRQLASEAIKTLVRLIEARKDGPTVPALSLGTRLTLRESTG